MYITMQGGDDNYTLWHPTYGFFDRVGPYGNSSLNYDDGWLYRKSGSLPQLAMLTLTSGLCVKTV